MDKRMVRGTVFHKHNFLLVFENQPDPDEMPHSLLGFLCLPKYMSKGTQ